jgi:hypothetical protein
MPLPCVPLGRRIEVIRRSTRPVSSEIAYEPPRLGRRGLATIISSHPYDIEEK